MMIFLVNGLLEEVSCFAAMTLMDVTPNEAMAQLITPWP
jgi:hypothetical protein